jgi:hypothetical protein
VTETQVLSPGTDAPTPGNAPKWWIKPWLKPWFLIGAGAVVAVALGAGWGLQASAQSNSLASANSQLKVDRGTIESYKATASHDAAVEKKAAAMQSTLATEQAAAKALQAKLQAEQNQVVANQFTDGQYVVGQNVAPGVYQETAGGECYYAWSTSTGSDAQIITNNIPNGPAEVTLKAGDIFTSTRCGTWNKVG